jgi:hypothetical protein
MLVATYLVVIVSRGLMTRAWPFGATLGLALTMEAAVSPMGVLVDATVVAGSTNDGSYGRARLWASVGWGGCAPVAGWLWSSGPRGCFTAFWIIYAFVSIPIILMPTSLLSRRAAPRVSAKADAAAPPPAEAEVVQATSAAAPGGAASRRVSRRSDAHDGGGAAAGAAAEPRLQPSSPAPRPASAAVVIEVTAAGSPAAPAPAEARALKPAGVEGACADEGEELWPCLRRLLADPRVLAFLLTAFVMGVANGFIGYLFLLLSDLRTPPRVADSRSRPPRLTSANRPPTAR